MRVDLVHAVGREQVGEHAAEQEQQEDHAADRAQRLLAEQAAHEAPTRRRAGGGGLRRGCVGDRHQRYLTLRIEQPVAQVDDAG